MDPDLDWFDSAEDERDSPESFIEDAIKQITLAHMKGPMILFVIYVLIVSVISTRFYALHVRRRSQRKTRTKEDRRKKRKADAVRALGEDFLTFAPHTKSGQTGAADARNEATRARLRKLWLSVKKKRALV